MDPKFLAIPIQRFDPSKNLASDVFLALPLNRKHIRIANSGDKLDPNLLERLTQKGHTHLAVSWNQALGSDPASYPVHQLSTSTDDSSPAVRLQMAQAQADQAVALPAEPAPKEEDEQRFGPDRNAEEPVQTFQAGANGPEASLQFSAEAASEEEQFRFQSDELEPVSETLISGKQEQKDEAAFTVKASSEEDQRVFRIGRELEQAQKSLSLGHPEPLDRVKLQQEAKAALIAAKASEKILALSQKAGDLSALEEMGELLAALEQAESGEPLPPEMAETFLSAEELAAVDQLLAIEDDKVLIEEVSQKISASAPCREEARRVTGGFEAETGDMTLTRTRAVRDLPGTASRLAAYLAHALGYSDIRFLTDLSLSAILYFAEKEGNQVEYGEAPELAKLALAPASPGDSVVDDCRSILEFLDRYFEDPECDLAQRDFAKKLFDKTVERLAATDSSIDGLNTERWAGIATKGPSMEAYSLCSRASAQALKASRSFVS